MAVEELEGGFQWQRQSQEILQNIRKLLRMRDVMKG
jgi:hypothetical protein